MKNKTSDHKTPHSFTQRIDGNDRDKVVELVGAELEGIEFELTNILRWEDDGGQSIVPPRPLLIGLRIDELGKIKI